MSSKQYFSCSLGLFFHKLKFFTPTPWTVRNSTEWTQPSSSPSSNIIEHCDCHWQWTRWLWRTPPSLDGVREDETHRGGGQWIHRCKIITIIIRDDDNLDHGQRWWTPMEMACSTTPSLFNSSRTNWDSSENPNRYQNVQQTWQYKYETWKSKQKCGWGKKWIRNVRSPQTWLGGTFGPTSKESCNITLDVKQPMCNWNGRVGKG